MSWVDWVVPLFCHDQKVWFVLCIHNDKNFVCLYRQRKYRKQIEHDILNFHRFSICFRGNCLKPYKVLRLKLNLPSIFYHRKSLSEKGSCSRYLTPSEIKNKKTNKTKRKKLTNFWRRFFVQNLNLMWHVSLNKREIWEDFMLSFWNYRKLFRILIFI